jgi:hypothetical protein
MITYAGRPLERVSLAGWGLELDQLMSSARRQTGLGHFGDGAFVEPMRRLISSALDEGDLSWIGRLSLRIVLTRNLVNRLRIQELIRRHPEIQDIPVQRPMVIVGWHRTGTTILHHLLALDPAARALPFWEMRHPVPRTFERDEAVSWRIKKSAQEVSWFLRAAPSFTDIHPLSAHYPEECQFLMDNYLPSAWFLPFQADSYGRWVLATIGFSSKSCCGSAPQRGWCSNGRTTFGTSGI